MRTHVRSLLLALATLTAATSAPARAQTASAADSTRAAVRGVASRAATIVPDSVGLAAVTSFSDLLQARVAGLQVERSSGLSGAGSRVVIRGQNSLVFSNEPLVIVDGIRMSGPSRPFGHEAARRTSVLDDLRPDDIARIEVLDGPAAASRFGTGGANGVLLVTTKEGTPGHVRWNAHAALGMLTQPTTFPGSYNQISTTGVRYCTVIAQAAGACIPDPDSLLVANPLERHSPFTTGSRRDVGVSVAGAGVDGTFYAAAGATTEDGVFAPNRLRDLTLRANGTLHVGAKLDLSLHTGYIDGRIHLPRDDDQDFSLLASGLLGDPALTQAHGGYLFSLDTVRAFDLARRIDHHAAGAAARWRPASWLTATASLGVDRYDRTDAGQDRAYLPTTYASGAEDFQKTKTADVAVTASWMLFRTVRLAPTLAAEWVRDTSMGITSASTGLGGTLFSYDSLVAYSQHRLRGLIGELRIDLNDRLHIVGGLRHDRVTDVLIDRSLTATYSSLRASWTVSGERWFPRSLIQQLTFRAAYGEAGQPLASTETTIPLGQLLLFPMVPHIDRSRETEAGIDATMLHERAGLTLTYYRRISKALEQIEAFPGTGPLSISVMEERLRNSGVEATFHTTPLSIAGISWRLSISAALPHNRVLSPGPTLLTSPWTLQEFRVGYPAGGFWGRPIRGFADRNHDGLIGTTDCGATGGSAAPNCEVTLGDTLAYLGSPYPTRVLALDSRVTFHRHLTIAALFDYRGGQSLFDATRLYRCFALVCREREDRSAPLADQAVVAAEQLGSSAGYIEDASYWKLRELSVQWLAPTGWAQHLGASRLALTVAGRNLATWTRYRGFDPEIDTNGQLSMTREDLFTLPLTRTFITRLDIAW